MDGLPGVEDEPTPVSAQGLADVRLDDGEVDRVGLRALPDLLAVDHDDHAPVAALGVSGRQHGAVVDQADIQPVRRIARPVRGDSGPLWPTHARTCSGVVNRSSPATQRFSCSRAYIDGVSRAALLGEDRLWTTTGSGPGVS